MARWLALIALLLSACVANAPSAPVAEAAPQLSAAPVEAEPQDDPTACAVTFSPVAELTAETEAAAARWAQATGCEIRVACGGIELRVIPNDDPTLWHESSNVFAGGRTYGEDGRTVIDMPVDHASINPFGLLHEMGHALARSLGHVETEGALMTSRAGEGKITAADLEYVCAKLNCQAFVPEA